VPIAVVIDAFSRRVIGWELADHLRAELALAALRMALASRTVSPNLIHRVDCSMTRLLCLRLHARPSGATAIVVANRHQAQSLCGIPDRPLVGKHLTESAELSIIAKRSPPGTRITVNVDGQPVLALGRPKIFPTACPPRNDQATVGRRRSRASG
jgi:hypothetical protein